jgi:hypothetical protein
METGRTHRGKMGRVRSHMKKKHQNQDTMEKYLKKELKVVPKWKTEKQ